MGNCGNARLHSMAASEAQETCKLWCYRFTGSKKLLHVKQEESEHVVPSLLRPSRFDLRHSALGFLDKLRLVGMYMGVSENWGTPYFGVLRIRILLFRVLYLGPYFGNSHIGISHVLNPKPRPAECPGCRIPKLPGDSNIS